MQIPVMAARWALVSLPSPSQGLCPRKGLQAHGLCRVLTLHSDTLAREFLVVGPVLGHRLHIVSSGGQAGWEPLPWSQCDFPPRLPLFWGLQNRVFLYPQPTVPTGAALTSSPVLQDLVCSSVLISVNANDI